MPTYNQWIERSTNEVASRDMLDRKACELFKWPYSKWEFCPHFMVLEWIALAILVREQKRDSNVDCVSPEAFDHYVIDNADVYDKRDEDVAHYRWFFENYKFVAWYQCK